MAEPRASLPPLRSFPAWLLALACGWLPSQGYPEGSCTWEEARAILEQSTELLAHVEQTLAVEPTGFALRLGAHYTDLSGHRVAPFTFRAVSKASPAVSLELVVEAELTFYDDAGKTVASSEPGRAHQVRQILTGIKLRPLPAAAMPEGDAEAVHQRTAWILEQDAAIRAAKLSPSTVAFPAQNSPWSGEARFFRDPAAKDALRSILVQATRTEDSRSSFEELYEFAGGELFLVRRRESHWITHPESPASSINRVVETKYFFHEGMIYQALEKRCEAAAPVGLTSEGMNAPEQRIALSGTESMQFLSRASRLSLVDDPASLLEVYAPSR